MFKHLKMLIEENIPFVVALKSTTNNSIYGYFVADDEDLTNDPKKALKYNTMQQAKDDAKINNAQWDLPNNQIFIALELSKSTRIE